MNDVPSPAPDALETWTGERFLRCPECDGRLVESSEDVRECRACQRLLLTWETDGGVKPGDSRVWLTLDPVFQGAYELEARLGAGATGRVYRARERSTGTAVAIKFLLADPTDVIGRTRFEREARLLQAIRHPAVVGLLGQGRLEMGTPYLVSAYVAGGTLRQMMAADTAPPHLTGPEPGPRIERRPLPAIRTAGIMAHILEGLGALHEAGIVHRDVKPENVLLDERGKPLVADLGLSRSATAAETAITQSGVILGTPRYLSPEVIKGEPAEPRSDLYACGVILYEMLCGQHPFPGASAFEIMRRHVHETPAPPGALLKGVPPDLDALVLSALAKDPANRPGSALEFARALRNIRWRLMRRRAARALAVAALAVLAVVTGPRWVPSAIWEPRGTRLAREATQHFDRGHFSTAMPLARSALGALASGGEARERADLWRLLGRASAHLGQVEDARRALKTALELHREAAGPDSPEATQDLMHLGHLEMTASHPDRAVAHYQEALTIRRRGPGVRGSLIADAMENLAKATIQMGQPRAGLELLREAAGMWDRCPQRPGESALPCLSVLAWQEAEHGTMSAALEANKRAVELARQLLSPDHVDLAGVLANMSGVYKRAGRLEDALELQQQALAVIDRGGNRRTPVGAQILSNLADTHLLRGTPQAAQPLLVEAVHIFRSIYPSGHPLLGLALYNLARALRAGPDQHEVPALLTEAEMHLARNRSPGSRDLVQTRLLLARTHIESRRAIESDRVLAALLAIPDAALTPALAGLPDQLVELARVVTRQGRANTARDLAGGALTLARKIPGVQQAALAALEREVGTLQEAAR